MSPPPPGWRCTWVWSAGRMSPGPRKPAWQSFPTEGEARDKAKALRGLAADLGACVACTVTQEKTA